MCASSFIKTCVISGLQQLFEYGYFHADPHPGNMFALKGGNAEYGNLAYVDFGMMDTITNSDRLTLIKAIVHIINDEYYNVGTGVQTSIANLCNTILDMKSSDLVVLNLYL